MKLSKQDKLVIGIVGTVMTIGVIYSFIKWLKSSTGLYKPNEMLVSNIFFSAGIESSVNANRQLDLFKQGVNDKNVIYQLFKHNESSDLIKAIKESSKPMVVVLYSASGKNTEKVAEALLSKGYSLNYLYVIEPYALASSGGFNPNGSHVKAIRKAISLGMPPKNLYFGSSYATGKGISESATPTPKRESHFQALTSVGNELKHKYWQTA